MRLALTIVSPAARRQADVLLEADPATPGGQVAAQLDRLLPTGAGPAAPPPGALALPGPPAPPGGPRRRQPVRGPEAGAAGPAGGRLPAPAGQRGQPGQPGGQPAP